jgi:hypothetical protein
MEKVTKKIGEFMRSRDSTVASCFVFSVIMSCRLSEADFFLNAQT